MNNEINYTKINAETIDSWVKDGWEWGQTYFSQGFYRSQKRKMVHGSNTYKTCTERMVSESQRQKGTGISSGRRAADADFSRHSVQTALFLIILKRSLKANEK